MPDFGDQEYLKMVCVESGNVGKNKLTLAPGKSSVLRVKLSSANGQG
jgi:D-hexose-6-phosphate mutarotase